MPRSASPERSAFPLAEIPQHVVNAETDGVAGSAAANTSASTRIGALIRKPGFDEIPQIFNVSRAI